MHHHAGDDTGGHGPLPSAERGATSLEYGLMIGLVAAVVAVALTPFGVAVRGLFLDAVAAFP